MPPLHRAIWISRVQFIAVSSFSAKGRGVCPHTVRTNYYPDYYTTGDGRKQEKRDGILAEFEGVKYVKYSSYDECEITTCGRCEVLRRSFRRRRATSFSPKRCRWQIKRGEKKEAARVPSLNEVGTRLPRREQTLVVLPHHDTHAGTKTIHRIVFLAALVPC